MRGDYNSSDLLVFSVCSSVANTCARSELLHQTLQRASPWLSVLQSPYCTSFGRGTPSVAACPTHCLPQRAAQNGSRPDSSNRWLVQKSPATNMGYWRTIAASTQGSSNNACSQPSPQAATDQLYHPDSSRLVRRPESCSVRAGSLPGCHYCGSGRVRDLVRSVALAVATSFWQLVAQGRAARNNWQRTPGRATFPILDVATNSRCKPESILLLLMQIR